MPIDPNIPLATVVPQVPVHIVDPLEQMGRVLTLGGLMQQRQIRDIELQTNQLALEQARRNALYDQNLANLLSKYRAPGATAPAAVPVTPGAVGQYPEPNLMRPAGPEGRMPALIAPVTPVGAGADVANLLAPPQPPITTMPAAPIAPPQQPGTTTGTPLAGGGTILPSMEDPFAGLPSTAELMQAGGPRGLALAKEFQALREQHYKATTEANVAQQGRLDRLASYMSTAHDETSKNAAVMQAASGPDPLLTPDQARQLINTPYNKEELDRYQTAALKAKERLEEDRAQKNQLFLDREHQHQIDMMGPQERKVTAEAAGQVLDTQAKQRMNDGSVLAAEFARADQIKDPVEAQAIRDQALNRLTTLDSKTFFMGAQSADEIRKRLLNPDQYFSNQRANLQLLNEAVRTNLDKRKFDLEHGPNTVESLVQQVYAHPDSAKDVPANLRAAVIERFRNEFNIPFPTPLEGTSLQQETAAKTALADVQWLRNAMQNPQIRDNLGPLLGNLQNVEQATGLATGLTNPQQAQEFRTRMRSMITDQAAAMRMRLNPKAIDDLQKGSGSVKMNADQLTGAFDAVEGEMKNKLDGFERQRFGGQKRPDDIRYPGAAVPANVESALKGATPGYHHRTEDNSWYFVDPSGKISRSSAPPGQ